MLRSGEMQENDNQCDQYHNFFHRIDDDLEYFLHLNIKNRHTAE